MKELFIKTLVDMSLLFTHLWYDHFAMRDVFQYQGYDLIVVSEKKAVIKSG